MQAKDAAGVISEFRASGGQLGGDLAGTPVLLLHHIGARTLTERVTALIYTAQDDGSLVVAASNGGSETHPAWYHNLRAHPTVMVEVGTESFTVSASEVLGPARSRLWGQLAAASPSLRRFQAGTARLIPLLRFTRIQDDTPTADFSSGLRSSATIRRRSLGPVRKPDGTADAEPRCGTASVFRAACRT